MNSEERYAKVLVSLKNDGNHSVTAFENSSIKLSGDYLIITAHGDNVHTSNVFALRNVIKYEVKQNIPLKSTTSS